jgi:hypothetical protein
MTVSRKEFEQLAEHDSVREAFAEVGIEVDHVVALADTLFELPITEETEQARAERSATQRGRAGSDPSSEVEPVEEEQPSKELSFNEFVELLVRTRPDNKASVMDLADLRQVLRVMVRGVDVRIGAAKSDLQKKLNEVVSDSEVGRLMSELDAVVTECEEALGAGVPVSPTMERIMHVERPGLERFDTDSNMNNNFTLDTQSP